MELEALLPTLAATLFGVAVWCSAVALSVKAAPLLERQAWWRLMLPLVGGAVALAFVAGWAAQEPDPADERAEPALIALAAFMSFVIIRAGVRAVSACRQSAAHHVAIGTIGLIRPHTVVSDEFRRAVSSPVLDAALAHEHAHARGRDPLRICVAQLAADLQWPIPGARGRLEAWLLALEARRDDDAVGAGVSPEDLAEAILAAARLQRHSHVAAVAGAAGAGQGIAWRVRRLLAEAPPSSPRSGSAWLPGVLCAVVICAALWLGFARGDVLLGFLPGVDQ